MDLSTRQGRREQGQRLQRAVERAGLSVEDIAGRIGCSRALIYQYLSGTTLAQPDRLQQIAAECGVSLAYFYSDDYEPSGAERSSLSSPGPGTDLPGQTSDKSAEFPARLMDSLRSLRELADAQEGPLDYRAVISTCERILSLAAQLGDRATVAYAWNRLGIAHLRMADFPRAADALARAVDMAVETGDVEAETSARQTLGNALLALGRAKQAEEQFTRVAAGTVFSGRWKGTLSLGAVHELRGEYRQAIQRFDETAALLEEAEAAGLARPEEVSVGLLYVNANRANVFMDEGDFRGARVLTEKCLAEAEGLGNADQHLEARFNLAWCDFHTGHWREAYRGFTAMLQLARFVGDQGRQTMARAWLGILLTSAGDCDSAITYGKDALAMALSRGDRRAEIYSQLALADAYGAQRGRGSEARYHAAQALAVATAQRQERHEVECRLRQARLSTVEGDDADALEAASRALSAAKKLGARHLEALARCALAGAVCTSITDRDRGRTQTEGLTSARAEATEALRLAHDIGLVEGEWRAHYLLATVAELSEPDDLSEAERNLRAAMAILERQRQDLMSIGLPDTLLEGREPIAVYDALARLLVRAGRAADAAQFLEQTGWPPLKARITFDADGGR